MDTQEVDPEQKTPTQSQALEMGSSRGPFYDCCVDDDQFSFTPSLEGLR